MGSEKDRPFAVDLPRAGEDRPAWVKVGVIAAVGFVVGVAWPRIAGVRLGPSAPGEAPSAASPPPAPRATEPSAATAPAVLATAPSAPSDAGVSGPPKVTVSRGVVGSCKTDDGDTLRGQTACGALASMDALVQPRLKRLRDCSAADGVTGKLAIVFGVDFPSNHLNVEVGKNSNVANVESIAGCVKHEFGGISIGALDHDHPKYAVSYAVTLGPPEPPSANAAAGAGATPGAPGSVASPGADAPTSSVVWEVAIVRDLPRTGQVVGRLQRGTKVRLGQSQDNWYRVRFGGNFASEGWVYRGAIGR